MKELGTFIVEQAHNEQRLDRWLSVVMRISRSQAERLIDGGAVMVDGKRPKKAGDRVKVGMNVLVHELETLTVTDNKRHKDVADLRPSVHVVADIDDYLVIEKPAGLIVHPPAQAITRSAVEASRTLASWILTHYPSTWGVGEYDNRPGIVHRLDKDTSGLIVIAKNQRMFVHLKEQFQSRQIQKKYFALVYGEIKTETGVIDFPIGRAEDGRMAARPRLGKITLKNAAKIQSGREAITEFALYKQYHGYTLLDVTLHTGRTHQIRVHLLAYNHPVVGDKLYFQKKLQSDKSLQLSRLFLHAHRLCFTALGGERACYESNMPSELNEFLLLLKEKKKNTH